MDSCPGQFPPRTFTLPCSVMGLRLELGLGLWIELGGNVRDGKRPGGHVRLSAKVGQINNVCRCVVRTHKQRCALRCDAAGRDGIGSKRFDPTWR